MEQYSLLVTDIIGHTSNPALIIKKEKLSYCTGTLVLITTVYNIYSDIYLGRVQSGWVYCFRIFQKLNLILPQLLTIQVLYNNNDDDIMVNFTHTKSRGAMM